MSAIAAETNSTKAVDAATPTIAPIAQSSDSVPLESIRRSTEATSSAQNVAPADGPAADAIDVVELAGQPSAASEPAESSTAALGVPSKSEDAIEEGPEPPAKEADDADMAIGDAQEHIGSGSAAEPGAPPICNITLLLTSGSRHPYKIDAKYLARRNVDIPDETEHGHPDPFSISIYTLKELILREWRSDWEAKPASPSSIRLIHFGKLLDDKEQLKKYQFSSEAPNVVHMSVRPQDLDEEEAKPGGKSLGAGTGDGQRSRSGGSCCVIL